MKDWCSSGTGCSGILVLWYSERVLMGSDVGFWEESVVVSKLGKCLNC